MKRKRPSVEIRKSDHPNKRMRDTAMRILLPTELVRRISEFVIELTHADYYQSLRSLGVARLRNPHFYVVETKNIDPFRHLPQEYFLMRPNEYFQTERTSFLSMNNKKPRYLLRFNRFEIANNGQRSAIFQTIEDVGRYIIHIPIMLLSKFSRVEE